MLIILGSGVHTFPRNLHMNFHFVDLQSRRSLAIINNGNKPFIGR